MAKQKQKPAKSKPITGNPLFPAVVGLWFGALFGLGSLAVRPSLIEDLVLRSRIDLIVPAAAPPLGVTARIMLALLLAAVGAVIGLVLARRLARPKIEARERTRGARGFAATSAAIRAGDAYGDAPSCTPVSIRDLDPSMPAAADNVLAGRRRALTIDEVEDHFVPHDSAPLPGGNLQILDVTELATSPLMPAPAAALPSAAPPQQNYDQAAPLAPVTLPPAEPARQEFLPEAATAAPPLTPDSAAAHADGRQVFGMSQPDPQPEQPRQIFGMAVNNDHVPQEFVREAGYRTTVFETDVPQPLFEREPVTETQLQPAEAALVAPHPVAEPAASPISAAPPTFAAAAAPPAFECPVELPAAEAPPTAMAAAAEAMPLPNPASLGMTDLAARLAESMRQRRAARSAAAAADPQPAPAIAQAAAIVESSASLAEPAPPEPAQDFGAEPAPLDLVVDQIAEVPPMPQEFMPVATAAPIEAAHIAAPVEPVAAVQDSPVPAPFDPLPNALRPLALDAFLEEDGEFESTLLPPRRMPLTPSAPAASAPIPAAYEPVPVSAEEVPDEAVVEENYASLLGIAQPRSGFVRIDEGEADGSAPEPVVIFPGQTPLTQPPASAMAAAQPLSDGNAFRRFDSPASAGHGQPVEMVSAAPALAAAEADQALRAALASLQRISGAA